ncbi:MULTISPECIES: hypothetical protein [unclassified Bradyrhizobium]|uniref:hypothetical protein n=1 Tax=unclassified Bradyrhizobium TaxID=2631580 RepID=UPI002478AF83|nr:MULTISPECIES: hypothetical protein [unclassified Bradyrhizobium]WGS23548.1 hypothetical protein MTX22_19160 [Bradyrhizobium sp. ISRA463]WGS30570.1 hypothetical protein MTX19_16870 [Bradyrhizobium sp. ISRA464]
MNVKLAIVGLAALGGVALTAAPASAMPNGIPNAGQVPNVERVRLVCNPWGRCWSRPNYYGAYAYGGVAMASSRVAMGLLTIRKRWLWTFS